MSYYIYSISLKYSPVHNAHCRAFAEPLRKHNYKIKYILSNEFDWMLTKSQKDDTLFLGSSKNAIDVMKDLLKYIKFKSILKNYFINNIPKILYFESVHPLNSLVIEVAKNTNPECKIFGLIHEPYVEEKSKHGKFKKYYIALQEKISYFLMKKYELIMVPSDEAYNQIEYKYKEFLNKTIKVPLLFEDRSIDNIIKQEYFTFVGHAVQAKGIDFFFELVKYSAKENNNLKFKIITSSNISLYIETLSDSEKKYLTIINHSNISDEEIDLAIKSSIAILAPYIRTTQSGVVPVAFMHSVPVISTSAGGMKEFVINDKTGFVIEIEDGVSAWIDLLIRTTTLDSCSYKTMQKNCRELFDNLFSSENIYKYIKNYIGEEKNV